MELNKGTAIQQLQKEQQMNPPQAEVGHGVIIENPEQDKWELDTTAHLDDLRHHLLGYSRNHSGVWVKDDTKESVMNEFGVSRLISELQARINHHMEMSELTKDEIHKITADAGDNYGFLLEDNWDRWGVREESVESELRSIAGIFVDNLIILMHISMNAGMRKHREKRGIKTYTQPAPPMGIY